MRLHFLILTLLLPAAIASAADKPQFVPAPNSPIATGGSPGSSAAGDINGDGALDLVVSNLKLGRAQILLGDNTGQFRISEESVPNKSAGIQILDANKDGLMDIAAAADWGYSVDIFLGNGKGGFAPSQGSPFKTRSGDDPRPYGLAAVDLNEDDHVDVLILNNLDGDASGAFGDGTGQFAAMPNPIPVGEEPFDLAVRDVNGDGHLDICAPTSEGRIAEVTILYGDGKGGFTRGTPFEGAPDPYCVAFGDVNGDGHDDIATIQVELPLITVGLGDGKGKFTVAPGSPFKMTGAAYATDLEMGDANGDGRMDLFLAAGRNIQVYLANKKGEFVPAPGSPYVAGRGTWRFVLGDWNKDGKCDIAAPDFDGGTVTILLAR